MGLGKDWLLHQAPRLLGVDDDLLGFEPQGMLRKLWLQKPFLLARTDRLWDSLVENVLGQKVQISKAKRSEQLIRRKFGQPAPGPVKAWILPPPSVVKKLGYYEFHDCGVERKRAQVLITAARKVDWLNNSIAEDLTAFKARLQSLPGIGPWTTALVTAEVFGDRDAVPVGDFHIPNIVSWALAGEARGTDDRMLELLEPYEGHRWRVIRLLKSNFSAPKFGPRLSLVADGLHRGA